MRILEININMSTDISIKAQKIHLVREILNMNTSEFGKICGYDKASIVLIEQGKRSVTDDLCERISTEFDVSKAWINDDNNLEGLFNKPNIENIFTKVNVEGNEVYPRKAIYPEKQGIRIQEVLKQSGLSRRDFCQKVEMTETNLRMALNGERRLTVRTAEKIENAFHVSVDWLLYGDESSKEDPLDKEMIAYLKAHPESRRTVKTIMKEEYGNESDSDDSRYSR